VAVTVDPGPLFRFAEIRIDGLPQGPMTNEEDALQLHDWELVEGEEARSGAVLAAEGRLTELWRQRGHPKAGATREIVADHRTQTVDVRLVAIPGPPAKLGAPRVTGTERLDPEFVRYMTGIESGEAYDPDTLERARDRLQRLGAFSSVAIEEEDTVGSDGVLPVTFRVSERKHRVIGGGASYSTIEGATLEAYWMHRNLFGQAESLRFDTSVSRIGAEEFSGLNYAAAATFRKPGVFTRDTDFTLQLGAKREFLDPYESRTISAKAGLEHQVNDDLRGSVALNAEYADIEDVFGQNEYAIVSLPGRLDYDARDNKLDPTEGLRGTIDAEPLVDFAGSTFALVASGSVSSYLSLQEDDRVVLAARGVAGTIVGGSLEEIPATRRFYLGGGGSIRGYEYRTVGPRLGDEVVGGLSFWEASAELRIRLTNQIGLVPFVDAGAAYEDSYPDFAEGVRFGAGLGLRYYTPLGPLRFDLAMPLNPRDGDPSVAFYIGLGQAF
jgi:translocation and assembly module TamA